MRSNKVIENAHDNINRLIRKGNELIRPLQHELRLIMWNHCGVIKNEMLLKEGIEKVRDLKNNLANLDVRIDEHNCDDLILASDLRSSLLSAEATIISALKRNESRGAHQRSDFTETNINFEFNCIVAFDKEEKNLKVTKIPLKKPKDELRVLIAKASREIDLKNKLLE